MSISSTFNNRSVSAPWKLCAVALAATACLPAMAKATKVVWRTDFGLVSGDGTNPSQSGLTPGLDGNFYGTTYSGGSANLGTVFRITPDGTKTTIHSFPNTSDGCRPSSGLTRTTDGTFIGITSACGQNGFGTVYRVNTAGTVSPLHSFSNAVEGRAGFEAGFPPVQASDGTIYGISFYGGPFNAGTLWKLTSGGAFSGLHYFGETSSDGLTPGSITLTSEGVLIGTAQSGGVGNMGTVFRYDPTSSAYSTLYSFTAQTVDGRLPISVLQGSDGNFYGTTYYGGYFNQGTVFKLTSKGVFSTLHHVYNNIVHEGTNPRCLLTEGVDGALYGCTLNASTVFRVTKSGVFSTLYTFTTGAGRLDDAVIWQSSDLYLYGTTPYGGAADDGTAFKLLPPKAPTSSITVTPRRTLPSSTLSVKWTSTSLSTCSASSNAAGWSGVLSSTNGTQTITAPAGYGRYWYTVNCLSSDGLSSSSALAELTVEPN